MQAISQGWEGDLPALPFLPAASLPSSLPTSWPHAPSLLFPSLLSSFRACSSHHPGLCTLAPLWPLPCSRPWVCPSPRSSFVGAPGVTDSWGWVRGWCVKSLRGLSMGGWVLNKSVGVDQDSPDADVFVLMLSRRAAHPKHIIFIT